MFVKCCITLWIWTGFYKISGYKEWKIIPANERRLWHVRNCSWCARNEGERVGWRPKEFNALGWSYGKYFKNPGILVFLSIYTRCLWVVFLDMWGIGFSIKPWETKAEQVIKWKWWQMRSLLLYNLYLFYRNTKIVFNRVDPTVFHAPTMRIKEKTLELWRGLLIL